jgi:hypothetical protein
MGRVGGQRHHLDVNGPYLKLLHERRAAQPVTTGRIVRYGCCAVAPPGGASDAHGVPRPAQLAGLLAGLGVHRAVGLLVLVQIGWAAVLRAITRCATSASRRRRPAGRRARHRSAGGQPQRLREARACSPTPPAAPLAQLRAAPGSGGPARGPGLRRGVRLPEADRVAARGAVHGPAGGTRVRRAADLVAAADSYAVRTANRARHPAPAGHGRPLAPRTGSRRPERSRRGSCRACCSPRWRR